MEKKIQKEFKALVSNRNRAQRNRKYSFTRNNMEAAKAEAELDKVIAEGGSE